MKSMRIPALAITVALYAPVSFGGAITQFTGFDNFSGTCAAASSPGYVDAWRQGINWANFRGNTLDAPVTANEACLFNRSFQEQFFQADGILKQEFRGIVAVDPVGVPFTEYAPGTLTISSATGTTETIVGSLGSGILGEIRLDADNLGLPEIKLLATATDEERITVNGFAATEYLWTGDSQTLDFSIAFDFYNSADPWELDGAVSNPGVAFSLWAGVATDMPLDAPIALRNFFTGNEIVSTEFSTNLFPAPPVTSAASPYADVIDLSFDVEPGDRFFLWTAAQALAAAGNFVNAANTVTTELALDGLTPQESAAVFETSLRLAPSDVSVPGTSFLVLGGLAFLWRRKR